jgi:hypothetical protein
MGLVVTGRVVMGRAIHGASSHRASSHERVAIVEIIRNLFEKVCGGNVID